MSYDLSEILKLPPEERLNIIGDLCDSLEEHQVPLHSWQIDEIRRRQELHLKDPSGSMSWEDFRKTLE